MVSAQRSYIMSRIKSRDTKPERRLAGALAARGWRFHKWSDLPGRPDIVLARHKVAVFVDGCFFHGCLLHGSRPKTNRDFWATKFKNNRLRDQAANIALSALGYAVVRLWEHEVNRELRTCVTKIAVAVGNGEVPAR